MAGINLSALASAFVRFLQRGTRRPRFARRRPLRRRGTGSGRQDHGIGFRRHGNSHSYPRRFGLGGRRRSGLGGRCRPFVLNRRRHGGRRHGYPRHAPVPATGRGVQEVAADVAGPSAPPPPAFSIPPMDWLLGGPAAPFLGEEDDFEAALLPPPPGIFFDNGLDAAVAFCPAHGYGPCPARHGYDPCPPPPATPPPEPEVVDAPYAYPDLPTPTSSDEDAELFFPPGYGPVPDLESQMPPPAVLSFDLNAQAEAEDEEIPVVAPGSPTVPAAQSAPAPPSPAPEARRLLRRFAAAMAARSSGTHASTWSPAALGFSNDATGSGESSSSKGGQHRA